MQQQKVVSWLSQHNFPHGLVSFADGLSTDPLGHKAAYLNKLVQVNNYLKLCIIYLISCLQRYSNNRFFSGTWCNNSSRIWQQ